MGKIDKNYLPALTGVRAIAAWMVFIHHFNPLGSAGNSHLKADWAPEFIYRFFNEFHVGVTIFFVLSGFLICFRYYDNFQFTSVWFRKYLKNRVARIYPMYFLLTLLTFFLIPVLLPEDKIQCTPAILALNITFLRGFFQNTVFTLIGQGWSLTVEECFYFSAPLIFFIAKKSKLFLQILAITSIGVLMVLLARYIHFYGFMDSFHFMWVYTFFGRCFEFFCGIQLALWIRNNRSFDLRINFTYCGIVAFIGVLLLISLQRPEGKDLGLDAPAGVFLNNYILPLAIVMVFYGLITEHTLVRKILATPFFEAMGKSSYIFYLIHMGVIQVLISRYISSNELLGFILLNVICYLLFSFIEDPLNRTIRKSSFLIKG